MEPTAGMSPSMETIAAGLAGFALANLFSFARKPLVIRQESLPTYSDTPPSNSPAMGHDYHILARLVADKQRQLDSMPRASGSEESMRQILKSFQPQLAEFSSFEWRANLAGQSFPNVSEVVGRGTHMTYAANRQLQGQQPTKPSNVTAWSQSEGNYSAPVTREHEVKRARSVESAPEDRAGTEQRSRGCCRKGDDTRRRGWGWGCHRGRDDETKPTGRDWPAPRDDDERWGWPQYRQGRQSWM